MLSVKGGVHQYWGDSDQIRSVSPYSISNARYCNCP
jgi:hypothetical protein